jgi:hypothetical protein
MRSVRILLGVVGGLALLGAAGCGAVQASAQTSSAGHLGTSFVSISPNSVAPGGTVAIRATCGDASTSATVTSLVFSSVTLVSQNGSLAGQASVPTTVAPGVFSVDMTCSSGLTASTTITIIGATPAPTATMGPHTGGGFLANGGDRGVNTGPVAWIIGGLAAIVGGVAFATWTRGRRRLAPVRRTAERRVDPVERR